MSVVIFCGAVAFAVAPQQHIHKKNNYVYTHVWSALTHNLQRHGIGYGYPLLPIDVASGPALVFALVLIGDIIDDQSRLIAALYVL